MTGKHVAMLLSNGYAPDLRVQKEAHTLALAGYRVTVIAWDRERQRPAHEVEPTPEALARELDAWPGRSTTPGRVSLVRIAVPGGYGTGNRLLWALLQFWRIALRELRRARPNVVHAHDLDTLLPAYLYARCSRAALVYDAHEYYAGMVQATAGHTISRALDRLEGWLVPRIDAVITTGERLAARLQAMGGHVTLVPNSQSLPGPEVAAAAQEFRRSLEIPQEALLVAYVGMLNPDRLLAPLLDAVSRLDQVWLVVGGTGPLRAQVEQAAAHCHRVRLLGWVPPERVPVIAAAADVVYYGLDAREPNTAYMVPNLLFFALAAGRPVLITPVGESAELVRRLQCGLVLDGVTSGSVEGALRQLCDPQLRAKLAFRTRDASGVHYRWLHAAATLLSVYSGLPMLIIV